MQQLRIYTLIDKQTAEDYFTGYWTKHIKSLPKYGFKCKGLWIGNTAESQNQVIAIVSFPDHADIKEMTECYMKSSDFIQEMAGFYKSKITSIETKIMKSAEMH